MALRINHNTTALNAWRNLNNSDMDMSKTLERLSSGYKINRAADGPASLVISEQMRAQIGSAQQAINNSEIGVSMVQTAEAALNEVNGMLVKMRELAIHASNEGANDSTMLEADQQEVENLILTIDRIARQAQFGTRTLLDGSNGTTGITVGRGLKFISATVEGQTSPVEGYKVDITREGRQPFAEGIRTLSQEEMDKGGVEFNLSEGGRNVRYTSKPGDSMEMIANQITRKLNVNQIPLELTVTEDGRFRVIHEKHGSEQYFSLGASVGGLLSVEGDVMETIQNGIDIEGTIGGEIAIGKGQFLTAAVGTKADGTVVQFNGDLAKDDLVYMNAEGKAFKAENIELDDSGYPTLVKFNEEGQPSLVSEKAMAMMEEGEKGEPMMLDITLGEDGIPYLTKPDGSQIPVDLDREGKIIERNAETHEGYLHLTNNALRFQVGPNGGQNVSIALPNTNTNRLATGINNDSGFQSLADLDVRTFEGAQDALKLIDDAVNQITATRGNLGAFQKNTLESNLKSLRYSTENMVAAESSIRDVDMAKEMSEFTKNQILMSSGVSMLSQANQSPKTILSLLGGQ